MAFSHILHKAKAITPKIAFCPLEGLKERILTANPAQVSAAVKHSWVLPLGTLKAPSRSHHLPLESKYGQKSCQMGPFGA